jgi:N-acetylglucosamine kinase-like BadF-type ATPase
MNTTPPTAAEKLKAKIADLNKMATDAVNCGDAVAYRRLVNEMIQIEDAYIDAHGQLPGA